MTHRWLVLGASLGLFFFTAACSDDTVAPLDTGSPDTALTEAGTDLGVDMSSDTSADGLVPDTVVTDTVIAPDAGGDAIVAPETSAPDAIVAPEIGIPETSVPDAVVAPETSVPDAIVLPETSVPDAVVSLDTGVPDAVVSPDTRIPDAVVSPDMSLLDVNVSDALPGPDSLSPDSQSPDSQSPDMAPPVGKVFFSTTTTSTTQYTWASVNLDGTGFQVISDGTHGPPPDMDLCPIGLAGITGPANVRRDRPRHVFFGNSSNNDGEDFIELPNGDKIVRFYEGAHYGLAIAHPNGTTGSILDAGAGSSCVATYRMALSQDGLLAAAVVNGTHVALIKLDGTTWPGTTPARAVLDVTPPTATFASISGRGLTMGATELLFVAEDASGQNTLWRAPRDGSAMATQVTLPQVGGNVPTYISVPVAVSADGTTFAMTAGSSNSKEDLIVIKGTTVTNISQINDNLYSAGTALADAMNPRIALSAQGTYVVYGATSSASAAHKKKAWVAKTDGTSSVEISNSGNFVRSNSSTSDVDTYGAFIFTDDDNLLFWAGKGSNTADLFHYKVSTSALANLTKTGTKTAAPWDGGSWESDGAWLSPSGAHVYYVAGTSGAMNIIGVETATFTKFDVTTGLNIDSEKFLDDDLEGQKGSPFIWFVANKTGATVASQDLYRFSQDAAAPATTLANLTNHSGATLISIENLSVSPDGAYAAYTTTTGVPAAVKLWAVGATGAPIALNGAGSYVEPTYSWTGDSKAIVVGLGTTGADKLDLHLVKVPSATDTLLHASQSYLFVVVASQPTP